MTSSNHYPGQLCSCYEFMFAIPFVNTKTVLHDDPSVFILWKERYIKQEDVLAMGAIFIVIVVVVRANH